MPSRFSESFKELKLIIYRVLSSSPALGTTGFRAFAENGEGHISVLATFVSLCSDARPLICTPTYLHTWSPCDGTCEFPRS